MFDWFLNTPLIMKLCTAEVYTQKQPPEVFFEKSCSEKFCNIHRKTPVLQFLFNKFSGLKHVGATASVSRTPRD